MSDSPPAEDRARRLVDRLASGDRAAAWSEFLEGYSGVILQVVHRAEWDAESRGDCFVFVCEALARDRCRRLRRFDPERGASFLTWVRLVVYNLCRDWRRGQVGRFRPFRSVARLAVLDEEIYRSVFGRGLTAGETCRVLRPDYPDLTDNEVAERLERIRRQLTPQQQWLLSRQRQKVVPLERNPGGDGPAEHPIADPGPGPESRAVIRQTRRRLASALDRLPDDDRLLVRLRFEQHLTLRQMAELAGLDNAQQADRRLREILRRLRRWMEGPPQR